MKNTNYFMISAMCLALLLMGCTSDLTSDSTTTEHIRVFLFRKLVNAL